MDKFERYINSIKRKYKERLINCEKLQWPPCQSSKLFTLQLVEGGRGQGYYARHTRGQESKIARLRTSIKYVDLFKVESGKSPVRKILVEGDAGIGKTTLSIAICEDWANERIFQEFKLLLLLPLRYKRVATAGSLAAILQILHPGEELCSLVAKYLMDIEGDEVLIIADGWDEIGKGDSLKDSFLYELLFEDHLSFASVIVTSRYSASAEFHRQSYFNKFIEITGFDSDSIVEYIQSEFSCEPSKADHLREQLEANPMLESVCSVPLNCAIVCHLWKLNSKEDLPKTMTELYSKIIRNIIFRNIQKDSNDPKDISGLSSFDYLPEDLKQPWKFLCQFAFETLVKDKMIFSEAELDEEFAAVHSKKVFCFGLLQESPFLFEDGYGKSYHFLHRTFQEFLAAFHLSKLTSESSITEEEVCQLFRSGDFEIVWRFLFGIYFNIFKLDNYHAIIPYIISQIFDHSDSTTLCHSAFESKNDLVFKEVIEAILVYNMSDDEDYTYPIAYSLHSYSAYDCAVVINFIGHMQDCLLSVCFDNCGIRQDQINHLGEIIKRTNVQIGSVELKGNKLVSVDGLFSTAQNNNFQLLYDLNLNDNMIKTVKFLKLPFNNLTGLHLSNNPLGINGLIALKTAIRSGSLPKLTTLDLKNCFTRNTPSNIDASKFSNFLRALSARCQFLIILDLSQNNLGVNGAIELAKVRSRHIAISSKYQKWWCQVMLTSTNLDDEALCSFTETLQCTWCFGDLQLGGNDIHATGLGCLVDAIDKGNISVTKLEFENNPLGLNGVTKIGKLLSINQEKLTCINLKNCQLHVTDAFTGDQDVGNELLVSQLCQMPQNTILTELYLDGNRFTGDTICILADLMQLCVSLNTLSTTDCSISSDDFNQLLDKLAQFMLSSDDTKYYACRKLHDWRLCNNKIDDRIESALMKHQWSFLFPELTLNLSGNQVSYEMTRTLVQEWNKRHESAREIAGDGTEDGQVDSSDSYGSEGQSTSRSDNFENEEASSNGCETEGEDTAASPILNSCTGTAVLHKTTETESPAREFVDRPGGGSDDFKDYVINPLGCRGMHTTEREPEACLQELPSAKRRRYSIARTVESSDSQPSDTKIRDSDSEYDDYEVENRFLSRIEWQEASDKKRVQIYDESAHQWQKIGEQLGLEHGKLVSIRRNYNDDCERVREVLGEWCDNANNLGNCQIYPKTWSGLILLLSNSDLGTLASKVHSALSAPKSSIHGNMV